MMLHSRKHRYPLTLLSPSTMSWQQTLSTSNVRGHMEPGPKSPSRVHLANTLLYASICKLQALRIFRYRLDVKAQFSGIPVPDIVSESSIRAYPNAETNDGCQCIRLEVQIIVPISAMLPRDILKGSLHCPQHQYPAQQKNHVRLQAYLREVGGCCPMN